MVNTKNAAAMPGPGHYLTTRSGRRNQRPSAAFKSGMKSRTSGGLEKSDDPGPGAHQQVDSSANVTAGSGFGLNLPNSKKSFHRNDYQFFGSTVS